MKKIALIIIHLIFFLATIQAQYFGGSGDGISQITLSSTPLGNYFIGTTSDFMLSSNWSKGLFPSNEYAEVRVSALNQPSLSDAITISAGTTLAIQSGSSLTINSNGNLSVAPGANIIINGTINNSGGLLLKCDETGSANIGESSGSIIGNISVQRYISSGKRAFRFFSHPFKNSIEINKTMTSNGLIITGQSGVINGFDESSSNNPSAFTFSEPAFNGTNNSGWNPITNTTNSIGVAAGFRALHRGARSQLPGILQANPPTPLSALIEWSGEVNLGSISFAMINTGGGANAGWNLIGNPYPSSINLGQIASANRNSIGTFAVWNPNMGTAGAYETKSFGTDYILPSGSAFFVNTPTSANFTFNESNKNTTLTATSLFKTSNTKETGLSIDVTSDDTIFWDQFRLINSENLSSSFEFERDGLKMKNSQVNLYSFSSDNKNLAIDFRPLNENMVVNLGFESTSPYHFKFSFNKFEVAGLNVYLLDNFENKKILLANGSQYEFITNSNSGSQGIERFQLIFEKTSTKLDKINLPKVGFGLYPNPAHSILNLYAENPIGAIEYEIFNQFGVFMFKGVVYFTDKNITEINVESIKNGIYYIRLNNGQSMKFVKI